MKKLLVEKDSDVIITIEIDGKKICDNTGIAVEELHRWLNDMGYGTLGWEKYDLRFEIQD